MTRPSIHQVVMPTMWGYATLTRRSHDALPEGGGTRRVDTVLPPTLTPDELAAFHDRLLERPGRCRHVALARSSAVRRALRGAIDLRTTAVLAPESTNQVLSGNVALASLVRAMRAVADTDLTISSQALVRQLVWCALIAARAAETDRVIDAATALRGLAATPAGGTASDRVEHA